ncbi:phosphoribosylglycinamide formyltransferase [Chryseomicrobium palamuruense]|uniref:Phosphoribosylglycinamide formyltransferase n=1 Tax=Chryseomicrobium palamuruense TaxID=682973 RepID=A0ABV8UYB7_9BACL
MAVSNPLVRFVVFASGSGSNAEALYQAVQQGELRGQLVGIVSDKPDAYIFTRAKDWGIPLIAVSPKQYETKDAYETAVLSILEELQAEWLVLAGYMRLIGPTLLAEFDGRIVNIHPSLLPAFPGKDAVGQAFAHGVHVTGVTVHYVDAGMDTGPIIAQQAVNVQATREDTEACIHTVEHELYKTALDQLWNEER